VGVSGGCVRGCVNFPNFQKSKKSNISKMTKKIVKNEERLEDDLKIIQDDLKNVGRQSGNYDNSQIRAWHLCTDPVLVIFRTPILIGVLID
jgi:hypothetical protein